MRSSPELRKWSLSYTHSDLESLHSKFMVESVLERGYVVKIGDQEICDGDSPSLARKKARKILSKLIS